ncbi:SDR family NAD(P)-dependent oxidoreductase [Streptomyces cinerochromogenes]|uniref:SDR family NAD(P)-dependent oxidoreductase n=1 Tax=Streptomyces cinerochromogenes TaxID=66422 RepID=A0ABW7BAC8_9ACTN
MELEELCWAEGLRVSRDTVERRIAVNPAGQFVVETDDGVCGVIYSQRIDGIGALDSVRFDTADRLHRADGAVAHVLSLNIDPRVQSLGYGDALLEHLLTWCHQEAGVGTAVGVTRCHDFERHPGWELSEYINARSTHGRCLDTVLRMHQLHGAEILRLVPDYRPADTANRGHGVLVAYDLGSRRERVRKLERTATENGADIPPPDQLADELREFLAETADIAPADRSADLLLESPLFELGIDSASLLDLQDRIEGRYGIQLGSLFFFECNTGSKIVDYLEGLREENPSAQTGVRGTPAPDGQDIAIVGMACRLPGGIDHYTELWRLLADRGSAVGPLPDGRWQWPEGIGPDTHPGIDRGGFVTDADRFEAGLFRITPNEARRMDPQQRWMLELSWACLEDAGQAPSAVAGAPIGVFVGASGSDYQRVMDTRRLPVRAHGGLATSMAIIANRVSYFFDLRGPSIQVDTACSSSLVAVHQAVRALRAGECEAALVGGVNVLCHPASSVAYHQAGMLSPDGLCKTFDAGANGYVRSEGGVVMLLKPLAAALADGDHVHAVIKGSATNHGGQAGGLTVPSAPMQASLVTAALADARVTPGEVTYVEAHGTGTALGDPIEVQGLTRAFAGSTTPCGLGSVKTNLGHLEAAAGITGLLKIVLSLRHGQLPASLHYERLNPKIALDGTPFSVVDRLRDWSAAADGVRVAGVSSFGSGGSNAHVIVAEPPAPAPRPDTTGTAQAPVAVVLSAESDELLVRQAGSLLAHLRTTRPGPAGLRDLAHTLQTGREPLTERLALLAADTAELETLLARVVAGERVAAPAGFRGRARRTGRATAPSPAGRDAARLAEDWVHGAAVDWSELYRDGARPRRIPLPTHVFARTRYWLDPEEAARPAGGHPLLHSTATGEDGERTHRSVFTRQDFFLRDHRVRNEPVLPAVAYLELAREAVHRALPTPATSADDTHVRLDDVVWARPVVVGDAPRTVHTTVGYEGDGRVAFEIRTTGPEGTTDTVTHARGRGSRAASAHDPLDLAALTARTETAVLGADECYDALRAAGLDYGPAHRALREVRLGERDALATLVVPDCVTATAGEYVLHPSVLDGALQAVYAPEIHAAGADADARTSAWQAPLPFALDSLEVRGATPATAYAWVREAAGSSDAVRRWDIDLCDEHGRVFAALRGYCARRRPDAAPRATERVTLLRPTWSERAAAVGRGPRYTARIALACGFDERLAELRTLAPHITFLDPAEPETGAAPDTGAVPQTGAVPDASADPATRPGQAVSARAIQLFQALRGILLGRPAGPVLVQVLVPADGTGRLHEALSGLLRTAHLENPALVGQLLSVPADATAAALAAALADDSRSPQDQRVRHEGGRRHVLGWEPLTARPADGTADVPWRERGVYLVTGGAGGLGLVFAAEIARRAPGAVLCLTGRSPLTADTEARFAALRDTGATVEYHVLDAADRQGTRDLVTDLVRRYGGLHGVLHCAGVLHDAFLLKKSAAEFRRVLRPKLDGAVSLDEATQDTELDFFVLFSSIMGTTGNVGQADYAVANAFLDAFAHRRDQLVRAGSRSGRTVAIGWPLWESGGMGADDTTREALRTRTGLTPMTTSAGVAAFHQALASGDPQVLVGAGDEAALRALLDGASGTDRTGTDWAGTDRAATDAALDAVPEQAEASADGTRPGLTDDTLGLLKQTLARVTGLAADGLDADELLGAYGMDSILATELTAALESTFGPLPKTLMFEYHTLSELAGYFVERHRPVLERMFAPSGATREAVREPLPAAADRTAVHEPVAEPHPDPEPARPATSALDIAIIGVSGRYPGARDLSEFWQNLRDGRDCVVEVPEDRWDWRAYYSEDRTRPGRHYSKWGGFIAEVDRFDPLFFNISPYEADFLDPQERLFLEHAWAALEDAGHTREDLRSIDGQVGVYAGAMWNQYQLLFRDGANPSAVGSSFASVANRVSYVMNLHGPSMTVDTMCSSSLTALELACRDLRDGRTRLAFAGGVNVTVHPNKYLSLSAGQFISGKGHCESFGIGGDGYIPGEGVGVVVLKPLRDAERDGDHVYGVIKGIGISHGGRTNGYTVPNPRAQRSAVADALREAGADPRAVSYVEAHGTGTKLGDPIEIAGLGQAFGEATERQSCLLGSVKSNIGHCESAAGIAGLTKVLLQLEHGEIAPSLHSRTLNPAIDFAATPFVVNQELRPWERPVVDGRIRPRLAGVSSFGAGGSNAHVLVEEYTDRRPAPPTGQPLLFPLSARDADRLRAYAGRLLRFVREKLVRERLVHEKAVREGAVREQDAGSGTALPADLAYTLQVGREAMDERLAVVADTWASLADRLERYLAGDTDIEDVVTGNAKRDRDTLASLLPADELAETTGRLLEQGRLDRLAGLWVRGASVDWRAPHRSGTPRRISAPTYPFARERHWVPEELAASAPENAPGNAPAPEAGPVGPARGEIRFLTKQWRPAPYPAPQPGDAARSVVVLHDAATAPLAAALARLCPGATLLPTGPGAERLAAGRAEECTAWIDLTGLSGPDRPGEPIALLQTLLTAKAARDLRLLYVTQGLEAHPRTRADLAGAARVGLYRMLGSEYGGLLSRHADLDPAVTDDERLAAVIRRELDASDDVVEVCHRDGVRYAPVLDELAPADASADASPVASAVASSVGFAVDEVLLVTGGTRGLGMLCARHLVRRYGVRRLVLTGRDPLPPRHLWDDPDACEGAVRDKIRAVRDLEGEGVEVRVLALPLDRADEVAAGLRAVEDTMGPIAGVVHAAGLVDTENPAFIRKSVEGIARVVSPKTEGTRNLLAALNARSPRFVLLFSSVSAAVPTLGAGQSDYAMGNAYLDYTAQAHGGDLPVTSIQWPSWRDTGFGEVTNQAYTDTGLLSITDAEGLALLDEILTSRRAPVVMPLLVDAARFDPAALLRPRRRPAAAPDQRAAAPVTGPAPAADRGASAPAERLMAFLGETFEVELRLKPGVLDPGTSYADYGADSILLAQVLQRIRRRLDVSLDPSALLEHSTLHALTAWLLDAFPAEVAAVFGASGASGTSGAAEPVHGTAEPASGAAPERQPTSPGEPAGSAAPVAVVGMACRLPGAPDLAAYWDLLSEGRSAIRPVPDDRWGRPAGFSAGVVDDVYGFDPGHFMLHPEDVRAMDPQALVLLEETLKAIHHAGYRHEDLDGSNTGVYVGARGRGRAEAGLLDAARNPIMAVGQNYLAANISQFFNWQGPAMVLDTACSSSLVAMKLATDALAAGSVDVAVVAGVSLLTDPSDHELFRRRGLLREDGAFHVFDRRAAGVVLGEGAGVVVLKPLAQAERDGDTVYAVVEGIAVNNDGRTAGPATPNLQAQQQVMRDALRRAGRSPGQLPYLETNGSGSQLTDLLELKAVQAVYRAAASDTSRVLHLGSLKPNIGHPLCAEGIAAFIKVALMVHHQRLVPFLSGRQPMEHFDLDAAGLAFPRRAEAADLPYAALSSFADGGTNGHVVVGRYGAPPGAARRGPVALPELTRTDVRTAVPAAHHDTTTVWIRHLHPAHPVLDHHRVHGRRLLPGLAWIDLLYRCFAETGEAPEGLELRNLTIHRPLAVDDTAVDLRIEARRDTADSWRVEAGDGAGRCITAEMHRVAPVSYDERARVPEDATARSLDEVYRGYRELELVHSGPMKAHGTVADAPDALWVRARAGEGENPEDHLFHPTLIDGSAVAATDALAGPSRGESRLFLPLFYKSFRASGPLRDACVTRIRRDTVDLRAELLTFTMEFFDADGHKVGELAEYTGKAVRQAGHINPARAGADTARQPVPAPAPAVVETDGRPVLDLVRSVVAELLGVPADQVSATTSYYEMGLDSAKLLRAATRLEETLGTPLSPTLLFEHPTVAELARHLSGAHRVTAAGAPTSTAAATDGEGDGDGRAPGASGDERTPDASGYEGIPGANDHVRAPRAGGAGEPGDIAVIGMAGRYPKARDLAEFWENLKTGRDCVTEVPKARWPHGDTPDGSPWGGFLDDVDCFDAGFFGIPADEAALLDPQERLFLEVCWEAVEDAGYTPAELSRDRGRGTGPRRAVGVYVGVMHQDYALLQEEAVRRGQRMPLAFNAATVAHRVSHVCDFHGPSLAVDTVCASSLNAVHLAVEALRRGECEAALAGGVNLSLHPAKYRTYGGLGLLAQDRPARSFGADGDGYVPAEAVGAVLLKPLEQALRDGDPVYAVIKGSAVNHSGRTPGFRVPSVAAQQAVITDCLDRAGVDPASLGCVEAHGTGTEIGDLMEVQALQRAFGTRTRRTGFCSLGSVKSAIGHAEAAAGIGSLTKAVLQLHHRTLTPLVRAERDNPYLDLDGSPFRLQTETEEWTAGTSGAGSPRRAGVSAFGATGANAHVVLEEAPVAAGSGEPATASGAVLVPLSAKDEDRLRAYAERLLDFLDTQDHLDLAALAHTLQTGRVALEERLVLSAHDLDGVREGLRGFLLGTRPANVWRARTPDLPGEARLLDEDDLLDDLVARWSAQGRLRKIAELWLEGYDVPWHRLHARPPHRLHLPTYPFARERHWIAGGTPAAYPLPQREELPEPGESSEPSELPEPSRPTAAADTEGRPPRVSVTGPVWRLAAEGEPLPARIDASAEDRARGFVRQLLAVQLGRTAEEIPVHTGFLDLGLGSLGAVRLTRELAGTVAPGFVPSTLFEHTTVAALAAHLTGAHPDRVARLVPDGAGPRPGPAPATPRPEVLGLLERLGTGALDLDDAIALLDAERSTK